MSDKTMPIDLGQHPDSNFDCDVGVQEPTMVSTKRGDLTRNPEACV